MNKVDKTYKLDRAYKKRHHMEGQLKSEKSSCLHATGFGFFIIASTFVHGLDDAVPNCSNS